VNPPPPDDARLIDARLAIQDWLNAFGDMSREEIVAYFGDRELGWSTWMHEEEEHPVLDYECHDYALSIYFYEDEVVNVSFQAMQEF